MRWPETVTKVLAMGRKAHVNVRRDVREAHSKREVKEKIVINKWCGVLQTYLKRSFSSGDKRVLLVVSEAEGDKKLICQPDEVEQYLRKLFEAWMGKDTKLGFDSCGAGGDELHPLFWQTVERRYLRRGLVRGSLVDSEYNERHFDTRFIG